MADKAGTSQVASREGPTKFKTFLEKAKCDEVTLVNHLSQVVELMTKKHEDNPVQAFEHVSGVIKKRRATPPIWFKRPPPDEEGSNLGYIRDHPEEIQAYLKTTSEFMVKPMLTF